MIIVDKNTNAAVEVTVKFHDVTDGKDVTGKINFCFRNQAVHKNHTVEVDDLIEAVNKIRADYYTVTSTMCNMWMYGMAHDIECDMHFTPTTRRV